MTIDQEIRAWLEQCRECFRELLTLDDRTLLAHIRSDGRIDMPPFIRKVEYESD